MFYILDSVSLGGCMFVFQQQLQYDTFFFDYITMINSIGFFIGI